MAEWRERGRGGRWSPNSRRSLMMKISISAKCNIEQRHFHQIISDTDQQAPLFPLLLLLLPSFPPSLPLCPVLAQRAHLSVGTVLAIFISGRQRLRRRHKMSVTCGLRASSPTSLTSPLPPASTPTQPALLLWLQLREQLAQIANSANSQENYLMRIFLLQKCA